MFIMTNNSVNYVPSVYQGTGPVSVILIKSLIIAGPTHTYSFQLVNDKDADFPELFPAAL